MLVSDDGDNDVFFDSVDSLSPQESPLTKNEYGYEVWVNKPLSVRERRERFLQEMGLAAASCSNSFEFDDSSIYFGMERMRECSGAVSNDCISCADQAPERLVRSGWEPTSEVEFSLDELKQRPEYESDTSFEGKVYEVSFDQKHVCREADAREESGDFGISIRKRKNWWKRLLSSRKEGGGGTVGGSKLNMGTARTRRIHVKQNQKMWTELSAMYIGQQIQAHKGLIWTMKFSPCGQYLASGGEDGVVRIWRVVLLDTSSISFNAADGDVGKVKRNISGSRKKHSNQTFTVLPNKIFQIDESPLQEFYGHSSGVLDLAWSSSDILLSSSMDKTVRMWQVGCDQCLSVFHHKDYVTCVQFNPVDENYFISGSIDGKIRIWGVREERVVDWAVIKDVISAISYQPDGKGFVVGSLTGICRFYVASGKQFQFEAEIPVSGKKRTSGCKITGIQFSKEDHQRVMITSEDSRVRILDGIEIVQTYKGFPKSRSQMSGSFTSSEKHIISVGEDSRVYIWNHDSFGNASSKQTKPNYSCEYFRSKGVTVAIPWSGTSAETRSSFRNFAHYSSETRHRQLEAAPSARESERFSFGRLFSIDGTCGGSMTWPEEKLPSWDLPLMEDDEFDNHQQQQQQCLNDPCNENSVSETFGLTIVAAGCDGTIKTFHNFGLPIRL